jgi:hypothetical protein
MYGNFMGRDASKMRGGRNRFSKWSRGADPYLWTYKAHIALGPFWFSLRDAGHLQQVWISRRSTSKKTSLFFCVPVLFAECFFSSFLRPTAP